MSFCSRIFRKLSLSQKTVLPLIVALVVGLGLLTWLTSSRSSTVIEDLSVQGGRALARTEASAVMGDFSSAFEVIRTLRDALIGMKKAGVSERAAYMEIVRQTALSHPNLSGIWTAWEPGALDGRDAEFANTAGHDATGRFIPSFSQADGDKVTLEPLQDYETPGKGDYYLLARNSNSEQILEPYAYETGGKSVLFASLAVPVFIDGKVAGVVGLDLSLDALNNRLNQIKVFKTGNLALISNKGLWVTSADPANVGKSVLTNTPNMNQALPQIAAGKSFSFADFSPVLDTQVIRTFEPILPGQTKTPWSIMANLPLDVIVEPVYDALWLNIAASVALTLFLALMITLQIRSQAVKPIQALTAIVSRMAEGDLDLVTPGIGRGDELGVMAGAIDVLRGNLIRNNEIQAREAEAQEERTQRAERISRLTNRFDEETTSVVESVTESATHMQGSATSMAMVAEETSKQAVAVADTSERTTENVQTVAAASEELSASVSEISRQVSEAATVAQEAVQKVEQTNATVTSLTDAANRIGSVIQLITDIASQTNLLALNATIEAARAGEAGKGFAVVASEVKNLANQTSKATGEIGEQINAMQAATTDAVEAISGIKDTIERLNGIAAAIAAAVEEQGAATQEISRNIQQAALGTQSVSGNIVSVSHSAGEAGEAAAQMLSNSKGLLQQIKGLQDQVGAFIADIRSA